MLVKLQPDCVVLIESHSFVARPPRITTSPAFLGVCGACVCGVFWWEIEFYTEKAFQKLLKINLIKRMSANAPTRSTKVFGARKLPLLWMAFDSCDQTNKCV